MRKGSTTTDWDEEEIARKITIQTGIAHAEWPCTLCGGNTVKINFLDLPGYSTFITETKASLIAADGVLITVDAHVGAQVTTEKVWDYCAEYDVPRAFVLTWMDRELASFERSLASLQEYSAHGGAAADADWRGKRISRSDRPGFDEGAFLYAGRRWQSPAGSHSRCFA